jgi:hypothetical protein
LVPRLQNFFSGWSAKAIRAESHTYKWMRERRRGDNGTCAGMACNLVIFYHTKINRHFPGVPSGTLEKARIIVQVFRQLSDVIRDADPSRISDS